MLKNQEPEKLPTDLETLTDEERQLFRRIGSRMKPYLVLGKSYILCFANPTGVYVIFFFY